MGRDALLGGGWLHVRPLLPTTRLQFVGMLGDEKARGRRWYKQTQDGEALGQNGDA